MQSERNFRAVAFFLTLKLYNVRKIVATMQLAMYFQMEINSIQAIFVDVSVQ